MMPMLRCLGVALTLLTLLATSSDAEPKELTAELRTVLEMYRKTYGFPGATVAYARPDGTLESMAVGVADIEAGTPMTPKSRMLAASIGKTIWGALVVSLEEEGVLDRADLVSKYLGDHSWYPRIPNADRITVGHLLTHSAGLPDHVHMEGITDALIRLGDAGDIDPADIAAFILDQPALFEAGSAWAYSDTGYVLLGMVTEAATGSDVFDLAHDRFLAPLGLDDTRPSNGPNLPGLAVGYTVDGNPFGIAPRTLDATGRLTWNPALEWTGGGFASTSADLAKWGHSLFTGQAMSGSYLERLLEGVPVHPDAPGVVYASGIAIYADTPFGRVLGHGGWVPGYVSSLRHYADHDLTIAFQINSDVGVVDDSTDLVPALEAALAELLIPAGRK